MLILADIGNAIDVGKNASGSNISACSISGDNHGVLTITVGGYHDYVVATFKIVEWVGRVDLFKPN